MTRPEVAVHLANCGLSEAVPASLAEALHTKRIAKNELVCRQGDPFTALYFVVEGKLQVDASHADGRLYVFGFERAPTLVGELEVLDREDYACNVSALQPTLALVAADSPPLEQARHDPQFLRLLARAIRRKVHSTALLHAEAAFPLEFRLVRYLTHRLEREGPTIILENRQSLAALLGTSPRHLNRMLRRLEEQQLISISTKNLVVRDATALRFAAGSLD